MIDKALAKIFGTKHERDVKRMMPVVSKINALEPSVSALSDDQLRAKTVEFRERLRPVVEALHAVEKEAKSPVKEQPEVKEAKATLNEALGELLPEAFAVCREAAKRTLNMRHFDVQLIGGMVLHQGRIA